MGLVWGRALKGPGDFFAMTAHFFFECSAFATVWRGLFGTIVGVLVSAVERIWGLKW